MVESLRNTYKPDYLVPPGEVLIEYLESYGITPNEMAVRTGLTEKTMNEIIKGKSPINTKNALKFAQILGRPANFWNSLEKQLQKDRMRLAEKEHKNPLVG